MAPSYSITVKNRTGVPQDYYLFSSPASVSGDASGSDVWSNVMHTLRTPRDGVARFEMSRSYYAICGTFDADPAHGGKVSVYKTQPVTVGTGEGAGMGSTVKLTVTEDGSVCDLETPVTPGEGKIGAFVVDTGTDFTQMDARKNNLFIGIASSRDGDRFAIENTFTPLPNCRYYLAPTETFYIAGGHTEESNLVKISVVGKRMAVDFRTRGADDVTLVQNEDGSFIFQ
ncbi:hypothetical protein Micbo1qcDRAFT_208367 [Microdochium bolleyi]|uniref:Uncharacterized protein n=1 Tax=Microdochium bolleyi TaxID=196109 RepID=A0A136IR48_9PEZI|nr:hypothetical protein Micbo1qcDRAFT_208367 [Microdochium bolleyi]